MNLVFEYKYYRNIFSTLRSDELLFSGNVLCVNYRKATRQWRMVGGLPWATVRGRCSTCRVSRRQPLYKRGINGGGINTSVGVVYVFSCRFLTSALARGVTVATTTAAAAALLMMTSIIRRVVDIRISRRHRRPPRPLPWIPILRVTGLGRADCWNLGSRSAVIVRRPNHRKAHGGIMDPLSVARLISRAQRAAGVRLSEKRPVVRVVDSANYRTEWRRHCVARQPTALSNGAAGSQRRAPTISAFTETIITTQTSAVWCDRHRRSHDFFIGGPRG